MFRHLIRVRYHECDPQGIVFNARWGEWVDHATTAFVSRRCGAGFDWRLVRQELTWTAPARFGDVVVLRPSVQEVGRSSFIVHTTLRRFDDGAPLGAATTTYVAVADGRACPLPDARRAALIADHALVIVDEADVGGGEVVRHVDAGARTTTPWRNGGGITHELHREGDGPCGFGLRLSIAEVASDGPFSSFPGVDRVIVLLEGAGLRLTRGPLEVRLETPGAPFAFHGDDPWHGALIDGPTLDFNVMTARGRPASVTLEAGKVTGRFVLALADGQIGQAQVARYDLVEVDGPVRVDAPSLVVRA